MTSGKLDTIRRSWYASLALLLPIQLASQQITFTEHVAPIIINNCVECHRPGAVTPFPFLTYEHVSSKAKLIKEVTSSRYMPPWIADPNFRHFDNERLLTKDQINTISLWVEQGKKKGDPSKMPAIPTYFENSLINRKPDLILRLPKPYKLPGNNKEHFIAHKFPVELPGPMSIESIEFIAGNRDLTHHMNFTIVIPEPNTCIYAGVRSVDKTLISTQELLRQINLLPAHEGIPNTVYYGSWVPGMSPQRFYGDIGINVPKSFVVLLDVVHYIGSPVNTTDDPKMYIFFKDKPVKRTVKMLNMGSGLSAIRPPLELQPNTVQSFVTRAQMPYDISIMYCMAHMHLLGKSFEAVAVPPPYKDTIP
ncbi:MAG: hypothetical protein IH946_08315, partial [Bacteroidetes bacterium]|nr:hypothetical protein [Bacteroidota bacterium]